MVMCVCSASTGGRRKNRVFHASLGYVVKTPAQDVLEAEGRGPRVRDVLSFVLIFLCLYCFRYLRKILNVAVETAHAFLQT